MPNTCVDVWTPQHISGISHAVRTITTGTGCYLQNDKREYWVTFYRRRLNESKCSFSLRSDGLRYRRQCSFEKIGYNHLLPLLETLWQLSMDLWFISRFIFLSNNTDILLAGYPCTLEILYFLQTDDFLFSVQKDIYASGKRKLCITKCNITIMSAYFFISVACHIVWVVYHLQVFLHTLIARLKC